MDATYDYQFDGGYADTVATIDGKQYWINVQYETVVCDGVAMLGDQKASVIADARVNGLFGKRPEEVVAPPVVEPEKNGFGWCNSCHSYCYGDCSFG
jgi:hypothetical protein